MREGLQHRLLLVFLAGLVGLGFQGTRGLFETSEGRYAECAREMVQSGDYLHPTLNHRPHWTKPPLTYWVIAGGLNLLGMNEWGARAGHALAFIVTALLVAGIGRTLYDAPTGLAAGLIFATSPLPSLGAFSLTTDMILTLWETAAMLAYAGSVRAALPGRQQWYVRLFWLFLGLGFLTKGPPALLPLVPVLIWNRRQSQPRPRLWDPAGLAAFAAAGFSWYAVVCLQTPGLWRVFLGQEIVDRVTSDAVHNHAWYKAPSVYLPPAALGLGLWSVMGFAAVARRRLYHWRVLRAEFRAGTPGALLLLWFAIPMAVFACATSKLQLYILPLAVPLALAVARGLTRRETASPGLPRWVPAAAAACALTLVGAKAVAAYVPNKHDMRRLARQCAALESRPAQTVVFDHSKMYGLQFYLGDELLRGTVSKLAPRFDLQLSQAIERMQQAGAGPAVWIFGPEGSRIGRILRARGLAFRTLANDHWILYRVEAK